MIGILALTFLLLACSVQLLSIALALWRVQKAPVPQTHLPAVSVIRPVCGIDQFDRGTLASSFYLDHHDYELVFCCAKSQDPAATLVEDLIQKHPDIRARLLIGDERPTANPKLNNIVKGWREAKYDWIVMADSNVIMPPDYLDRLFAARKDDTGLVCSPPLGCLADGFWAEVECAFLNTYQARWQIAADTVGLGFAQGKSMLWQRQVIERAGGIEALGAEVAEDAAATKIARTQGKKVHLVDLPFEQPLGRRTAKQVLDRQLRWAKLRRASFPAYYVPEILTGMLPALIASVVVADSYAIDHAWAALCLVSAWYLAEAELNRRAGWHFTWIAPLAWLARDILIPCIWTMGWIGNSFNWRGNGMTVSTTPRTHTARQATPAPT